MNWSIDPMSLVFTNGTGYQVSIPDRVITKTKQLYLMPLA